MTILGFDTATGDTAVALTGSDGLLVERRAGPDREGRPRHTATLLSEVESAVEEGGGWNQVELIAVGLGPGSYTGLRIGIATARAIAHSLRKPIAGVSSLAALARGISELQAAAGRPRLGAIDARRGELFAALYGDRGEELWAPFVAGPEKLRARLASLRSPPLAAGDGALRFRDELEAAGVTVPPDRASVHRIAARHICELAEAMAPAKINQIKPVYLRAPDAEVWLERDRKHHEPRG